MKCKNLFLAALIFVTSSVSKAEISTDQAQIAECTSEETNNHFRKLDWQNAGKIWLDVYPSDHGCLEVLKLNHAWQAFKKYDDIDKENKDLLSKRIDALNLLRQQIDEAKTAMKTALPDKGTAELDYIRNRIGEKEEHLYQLKSFMERASKVKSVEEFVRPRMPTKGLATLVKKPSYSREIIFHLDPGLRRQNMEEAWKKWRKNTNAGSNLSELPSFYLWLEKQRNLDFPLAEEGFRDNSSFKVHKGVNGYYTDNYGSFARLKNIDIDESGENGEPFFLYVLSQSDELFIAQSKDLAMHSLFLHGAPVKGAGMLSIRDGKINYINRGSGHYRPSEEILLNAVNIIRREYPEIFSETLEIDKFSGTEK